MKKLSDRIKFIRKHIPVKDFARKLGVSSAYIYDIEKDKKEVISDILAELISTKFNCQRHWLLTGEGPMYREPGGDDPYNKVKEDVNRKILQLLDGMPEDDRRDILKHIEEKKLLKELIEERKGKKEAG